MGGSSHGLRNEMHFWLKELHRLVQCSRFLLARDQKYLCLMEAGESGKMLSSLITDELKLVVHPVGSSVLVVLGNKKKVARAGLVQQRTPTQDMADDFLGDIFLSAFLHWVHGGSALWLSAWEVRESPKKCYDPKSAYAGGNYSSPSCRVTLALR
jgi:hypothetical protein